MQFGVELQHSVAEAGASIDAFLELIDEILREGRHEMAYRLLKAVQAWTGKRHQIDDRLSALYRKLVPRWHFDMLNDLQRGQAFADALATWDLGDKTVLDIGAGSGILSMLAVRNGAKHVYACEILEPLADIATEIVQLNGMAHKITIIPKSSFELEIGKDLPARVQVMISETIDCGFVGEGFLAGLRHAKNHLLEPHALLVPYGMQLCGALVESPRIHHLNQVDHAQGFDVSKMNEFSSRGYFGVRLNSRPHRLMSEVKMLIDMDLYGLVPERINHVIEFQANKTGTVHGVGFWFKAALAPSVTLTNDPDRNDGHWTQAFATFRTPVAVQKGSSYSIEVTISDHAVSIAPMQQQKLSVAAALERTSARENLPNAV